MTDREKIAALNLDPTQMRYWPWLFGNLPQPKDLRPPEKNKKSILKGVPLTTAGVQPAVVTSLGNTGR
jgi:hypothetical protein